MRIPHFIYVRTDAQHSQSINCTFINDHWLACSGYPREGSAKNRSKAQDTPALSPPPAFQGGKTTAQSQ